MSRVIWKIRRLSINQLRALAVLAGDKNGMAEAEDAAGSLKLKGKSLGGVFSALSRQKIGGQSLVVAFGRGHEGRGLRWKLNEKLINRQELKVLVKELLAYD